MTQMRAWQKLKHSMLIDDRETECRRKSKREEERRASTITAAHCVRKSGVKKTTIVELNNKHRFWDDVQVILSALL